MTDLIKKMLAWACGCGLASAFALWRYFTPLPDVAHVAVLYDRSRSLPADCTAVVALAQTGLTLPDVVDGSTLTFFTTGDQASGYHALLVATYHLPVSRLATETPRRLYERQQKFLADLRNSCAQLSVTDTSPLARAIADVMAHLRAFDTSAKSPAYLFARTDLQETVDAGVRKALWSKYDASSNVTTRIDNTGIRATFCGYAETLGRERDLRHTQREERRQFGGSDRIQRVWVAVFVHPELVKFKPFCAGPEKDNAQ